MHFPEQLKQDRSSANVWNSGTISILTHGHIVANVLRKAFPQCFAYCCTFKLDMSLINVKASCKSYELYFSKYVFMLNNKHIDVFTDFHNCYEG